MIELYRRLARRCRSVNQLNALHIALENRITPVELQRLHAGRQGVAAALRGIAQTQLDGWRRRLGGRPAPRPASPTPPRAWMHKLVGLYARSGKPQPEPYLRRRLGRHLTLYSDGGERAGKQLLICFTGSSQRPFVPVPVFLQHLDAQRTDLLLVGYPRRHGHRRGLEHLGPDLESSIDALRRVARIDEYRRCAALGTSGGGLPAVLAALRLGLAAALSAGSRRPDDERWLDALGESVAAVAARYAQALPRLPEIVLAHGRDDPKDIASAQALAAAVPATVLPIDDRWRPVGHNVFRPLLRRGELASFLASTVLGEAPEPARPSLAVQAGVAITTTPSSSA